MVSLDTEKCEACGRCKTVCPQEAITAFGYPVVDPKRCDDCSRPVTKSADAPHGKEEGENREARRRVERRLCVMFCPVEALHPESSSISLSEIGRAI